MGNSDRAPITQKDVDEFLRVNGVRKPRWYQRDISRIVTKSIGIAILMMFLVGAHYIGVVQSAVGTLGFVGGICLLLAIYLTYTWQWPRLIRYFRTRWREYRGY